MPEQEKGWGGGGGGGGVSPEWKSTSRNRTKGN